MHSLNLVGSHDTTRARTLVAHDPRLSEVAAGMLLTMPSIPMVTYGDEIGMEGDYGEDGRRPMPWDERRWDGALFECYRSLIAVRRGSVALRRGGLRWVHAGDDDIVYLRESAHETALVHLALAAHDPVVLDRRRLGGERRRPHRIRSFAPDHPRYRDSGGAGSCRGSPRVDSHADAPWPPT